MPESRAELRAAPPTRWISSGKESENFQMGSRTRGILPHVASSAIGEIAAAFLPRRALAEEHGPASPAVG